MEVAVHGIGAVGVLGLIVLPWLRVRNWEHWIGGWGVLWMWTGAVLGLAWAPAERHMGEVGRILYMHVPTAWACLVVFTAAFIAALGFLMTSRNRFDAVTEAACEVGVVLNVALMATGSLFARPTWNTWWVWEPRLITSLLTALTFIGVLLLRGALRDPDARGTWTAVATIVAYVNVPITYFVVQYLPGIHQFPSTPDTVDPSMKLVLRMCAWGLLMVCVWFIARRTRIALERSETPAVPSHF